MRPRNAPASPSGAKKVVLLAVAALAGVLTPMPGTAAPQASPANSQWALQGVGQLPLSFEPNRGQAEAGVQFLARGRGYTLFLSANRAVLVLGGPGRPRVVQLKLVGARPEARATGLEELPGKSHYFLGNDPARWRTNVPHYARVKFEQVYPGIDLVFYGTNARRLEFDFVVAPGANPDAIALGVEGADEMTQDEEGNLLLRAPGHTVWLRAPLLYQEVGGARQAVAGAYLLEAGGLVRLAVGAYDRAQPLIIDPVLSYSTFLGGNSEESTGSIALDAAGNAYITGSTLSANFPVTPGAFQTTHANPCPAVECTDAFVTKLNATGTALVYSTFLGGSEESEGGAAIAVDASGNAYVTGETFSNNFPTTPGAFQTSFQGGFADGFVTKLNADGSALVYSTYLGGSGREGGKSLALDADGSGYAAGATDSVNFPVTQGAFQMSFGGGQDDAFISKLNPGGDALVYSTYLGANDSDQATGLAIDSEGNAYVVGTTGSSNFPTTVGSFQTTFGGSIDAFVTKLNPTGTALVYSTYLGGSGGDRGEGIALDAWGTRGWLGAQTPQTFPPPPAPSKTLSREGSGMHLSPS